MSGQQRARSIKGIDDLVNLGLSDLIAFCRWPLGMKLWQCQRNWNDWMQDRLKHGTKQGILVLAPSNHGKSTSLVVPLMLWLQARHRVNGEWRPGEARIMVVGSKDDLAARHGFRLDGLFTRKADDLARFGLIKGPVWSAFQKMLVRDNDDLITPSYQFVGPGSEIQGERADYIIFTDLATFRNAESHDKRLKLEAYVEESVMNRLEPGGRYIAEGHMVDNQDIYHKWLEDEDWDCRVWPAVLKEPSSSEPAELLCPERWSWDKLHRIRVRAPKVFAHSMQNMDWTEAASISREAFEACLDRWRPMRYSPLTAEDRQAYAKVILTLDPAWSIKRWAKYSVIHVIGMPKTTPGQSPRWEFLHTWRDRVRPDQLREKVKLMIRTWLPDRAYLEDNAAQVVFTSQVKADLGLLASRVVEVTTSGSDGTLEETISTVYKMVEAGLARFPYGDRGSQEAAEQMLWEMMNYPGRYTDTLMSWVVGIKGEGAYSRPGVKVTQTQGMAQAVSRGMWSGRRMGSVRVMTERRG